MIGPGKEKMIVDWGDGHIEEVPLPDFPDGKAPICRENPCDLDGHEDPDWEKTEEE